MMVYQKNATDFSAMISFSYMLEVYQTRSIGTCVLLLGYRDMLSGLYMFWADDTTQEFLILGLNLSGNC